MALTKISTDGVKDDAITKTKIPANQIEASELADNAVDTNAIANNAVTSGKLASGVTDLSNDTSPQLGGDLYANGNQILVEDSTGSNHNRLKFGNSSDLQIYHDNNSKIHGSSGYTLLSAQNGSVYIDGNSIFLRSGDGGETYAKFVDDGKVELRFDDSIKLETKSQGFALMEDSTTRLSFTYSNSLNFITANAGNEIKVSSGNGDANGIEFWDYTGVNKRCQIDAEGIKFNTDTAAANGLDDYEEGDWTPDVQGRTSATPSLRSGHYVKVGTVVHLTCHFDTGSNNLTSSQTTFNITGVPFAARGGNAYASTASIHFNNGYSTAGNRGELNGLLAPNNNKISIYYSDSSTIVHFPVSDFATGNFLFSMTYIAAA